MARSCSDLFLKIRVSSSTSPHKPWQSSVMSVLSFHDISYKWDHLTWILFYFIGVMFGGFRHSAFLSDLNQYILLISLLVTFSFVPIICPHKDRRNHLKMTKKRIHVTVACINMLIACMLFICKKVALTTTSDVAIGNGFSMIHLHLKAIGVGAMIIYL